MLTTRSRATRAAALAASLLAVAPFAASTANAAASPAVGSAGSTITLLRVDSAAASLRALSATLSASTAANPDTASITVTPVWSAATGAVGEVSVTPASSPKHVGSDSIALPSGLASIDGPAVDVVAKVANGTASSSITGNALGTISVLGTPLALGNGGISLSSSTDKSFASSTKSITLSNLALPSIADMLASLGLDLSKLTQGQLNSLFDVVSSTLSSTVTAAVTAASNAANTARAAVGSAAASVNTVAGATSLVNSSQTADNNAQTADDNAQTAVNSAQTAFNSQIAAVNNAIGAINTALGVASLPQLSGPLDAQSWAAVTSQQKAVVTTVLNTGSTGVTAGTVDGALATLNAANTALAAADTALAAADAALAAAQALLQALLDLVNLVTSGLDSDPLAKLGGISAETSAVAGAVGTATGHLTVGSLDVLGVTSLANQVTSQLVNVTTPLTDALNAITGVTFTPPKIEVGAVHKSVSKVAKTATAQVTVDGLKITLPTIKLPSALALPGAGNLPGLDLANGVLSSLAGSVTVAELQDNASFTGGTATGTPGGTPTPTGGGSLPTTGAPAALAVMALVAVGLGIALRRRTRTTE